MAALSDVNLRLQQGRLVAVVGPKSGGKSTLLRLLAQVSYPVVGEAPPARFELAIS